MPIEARRPVEGLAASPGCRSLSEQSSGASGVRTLLALVGILTALPSGASPAGLDAEAVLRHLAEAQSQGRDANWQAARQAVAAAAALLREEPRLTLPKVVVVHEPHRGLGLYTPAQRGQVRGRLLRLYVEAEHIGHRLLPSDEGGERAEVELEVAGTFFVDGQNIGERSLGTHRFVTRTPIALTSFGVEATLGDKAPAGVYEVLLRVRDVVTGQVASHRARFLLGDNLR